MTSNKNRLNIEESFTRHPKRIHFIEDLDNKNTLRTTYSNPSLSIQVARCPTHCVYACSPRTKAPVTAATAVRPSTRILAARCCCPVETSSASTASAARRTMTG